MNVQVGNVISQELSELLKEYATSNDRANVVMISKIGTSTIRDVILRNNSVSENSIGPLLELIKASKQNAIDRINHANMAVKIFDDCLTVAV